MWVLGGAEGARDQLILGRCGFSMVFHQSIWVVSSFECFENENLIKNGDIAGKHEDFTFDIVPNLPGEGL